MPPSDLDAETLGADPAGLSERGRTGADVSNDAHNQRDGIKLRKQIARLDRGATLGRYVVLDRLGAGAMGVVYAAYDPELDRKIAIKLLQSYIDDPNTAAMNGQARLVREAQAMARVTHPNVIAVYDVGTIDDAVFVAMEHVQGQTLTEYAGARDHALSWRETTALYAAAGHGLAAAHSAGLVHRDFKPDNVMVADDGRVLVLDFGLARPAGPDPTEDPTDAMVLASSEAARLSDGAALTRTGAVIGTPAYMSPEQMAGLPATAASDQFSLCVGLYESLYGERPFEGTSIANLAHSILGERVREPPKGTAVPAWLRRAILRGLKRRGGDRFPSMEALLAAIEHNPAKRRNRVLAAGAGAMLIAAGVGAGTRLAASPDPCAEAAVAMDSVWGPEQSATVATAFAALEKAYADETLDRLAPLLDTYARTWVASRTDACRAARVRGEQSDAVMSMRMACLDRSLQRLDIFVDSLADPNDKIVTGALASAHGLPPLDVCENVEVLALEVPPPDDPAVREEVAAIELALVRAVTLKAASRMTDALALAEPLLPRAEQTGYRPIIARVKIELADYRGQVGQAAEAAKLAKASVLAAEASGSDRLLLKALVTTASITSVGMNDFAGAEALLDRADAVSTRRGDHVAERVALLSGRARLARSRADWKTAIVQMQAAYDLQAQHGLDSSPKAVRTLNDLGIYLVHEGELERAALVSEQALALARKVHGPSHPEVAKTGVLQARLRGAQDRPRESIEIYLRTRKLYVDSLGEATVPVAAIDNELGLTYAGLGELTQALTAYEATLDVIVEVRGADTLGAAAVHNNLGNLLRTMGRATEALEHHQAALEINRLRLGERSKAMALAHDNIGDDYLRHGDFAKAAASFATSMEIFEALAEPVSDTTKAYPLAGLGMAHLALGQTVLARSELERATELGLTEARSPGLNARAQYPLARLLYAAGEHAEARRLAREAEAGWKVSDVVDRAAIASARDWLVKHAPELGLSPEDPLHPGPPTPSK